VILVALATIGIANFVARLCGDGSQILNPLGTLYPHDHEVFLARQESCDDLFSLSLARVDEFGSSGLI
jgi:hypothetical protein